MALRKNMIKRIAGDRRGKITTGTKKISAKGKEYPASLDHFNVTAFPELMDVYGDKPDRLLVYFVSSDIESFMRSEWSEWGNNIKKRACDGETMTDFITGKTEPCACDGFSCGAGLKCWTEFRAYVGNPYDNGKIISPIPYRFETHSPNSGDSIYYGIENIFEMTGGKLVGVPFMLTVRMVETVKDGEKKKYPLWDIQPIGNAQSIVMLAERATIPTVRENSLAIDFNQPIAALTSPETLEQSPIHTSSNGAGSDAGSVISFGKNDGLATAIKETYSFFEKVDDCVELVRKENKSIDDIALLTYFFVFFLADTIKEEMDGIIQGISEFPGNDGSPMFIEKADWLLKGDFKKQHPDWLRTTYGKCKTQLSKMLLTK